MSRSTTMCSCCLLMLSSLVALLFWGPSIRALECLQSLLDLLNSMCFLSIQSPVAPLTTLYGRLSTDSGTVNGVSALSLPKMPSCLGTHTSWTELCFASLLRHSRHSRTNLDLTFTDYRAFRGHNPILVNICQFYIFSWRSPMYFFWSFI